MTVRPETSESWRARAPSQRERVLAFLRVGLREYWTDGWTCSVTWPGIGIRRGGARIWELRHQEFHDIEERICAEHKVAEYRLRYDATWDKEP